MRSGRIILSVTASIRLTTVAAKIAARQTNLELAKVAFLHTAARSRVKDGYPNEPFLLAWPTAP